MTGIHTNPPTSFSIPSLSLSLLVCIAFFNPPGLEGAWQQKPLLNGREVTQLLGIKQGDKSTGAWVSVSGKSAEYAGIAERFPYDVVQNVCNHIKDMDQAPNVSSYMEFNPYHCGFSQI